MHIYSIDVPCRGTSLIRGNHSENDRVPTLKFENVQTKTVRCQLLNARTLSKNGRVSVLQPKNVSKNDQVSPFLNL